MDKAISSQSLKPPGIAPPSKPATFLNLCREPLRSPPRTRRLINDTDGVEVKCDWNKVSAGLKAAIVQAAKECKWPWYFYGPAGRGKTSAAGCVYRYFDGPPFGEFGSVHWWDAGMITRAMVLATARIEGNEASILRTVSIARLIVIDDVGTREPTAAQLDALRTIINTRGTRPMILTGNLSPDEMIQFIKDDRIVSRICSGTIFNVTGSDRRLAGATLFEV